MKGQAATVAMRTGALAFENVTCARGQRLVFADVSFALGAGEALVVTGPNGAGKSTLLRLAAGLLRPTAGRVAREGSVALQGEAHALDGELSLAAALRFWARLDAALDGASDAVEAALDAFGLAAIATVPVRLLSTGQRRRAALARVVASGAPLWLLDEPASGLDMAAVELLGAAIARHRAAGGALVAATHQPLDLPGATKLALA